MQEGRRQGPLGASLSTAGRAGPGWAGLGAGSEDASRAPGSVSCWRPPGANCSRASPLPPRSRQSFTSAGEAPPAPGPESRRSRGDPGAERRGRRSARLDFPRAPTARSAGAPPRAGGPACPATSPRLRARPWAARIAAGRRLRSGRIPSQPRGAFSPFPPRVGDLNSRNPVRGGEDKTVQAVRPRRQRSFSGALQIRGCRLPQ